MSINRRDRRDYVKGEKIRLISDKWSFEQLIDVQNRISNERNRASIKRLDELNRKFEEALLREGGNRE